MTVLRKRQKSHFAHIDNEILQDDRLTFKAKGVAAYLLSLPNDWNIKIDNIAKAGKEGRDAVRTALAELAEYGYLRRNREQGKGGKITTVTYIADHPCFADQGTTLERLNGYELDKPTYGLSEGRSAERSVSDRSVNGESYKDVEQTKQTKKEGQQPTPPSGGGSGDPEDPKSKVEQLWTDAELHPKATNKVMADQFGAWLEQYGLDEIEAVIRIAVNSEAKTPAAFVSSVLERRKIDRENRERRERNRTGNQEVNFGMLPARDDDPADAEQRHSIPDFDNPLFVIHEFDEFRDCAMHLELDSSRIKIEYGAYDWANLRAKNNVESRLRGAGFQEFTVEFVPIGATT